MRKLMIAMLLIGCIAQASEFKHYKCETIESCVQKLNKLNKVFNIYSYEIVPTYFRKTMRGFGSELRTTEYELIIEIKR